jgi:5'-3' exonuclease
LGIDHFHKWLGATYAESYVNYNELIVDNLYIDINFALHHSIYCTKNEKVLYFKLEAFISDLIQKIMPRKSLVLATDGSAPYAKIILQRKRRLQYSRSNDTPEISSLMFTPGTKFMTGLENNLKKFIEATQQKYKINVITKFGGANEAEIKIINEIKKKDSESHVVVSNDADTVVMLSTVGIKKLYVFVKNPTIRVVSIDKLLKSIKNKNGKSAQTGLDFALISLLMGNDYLPKLLYVNFENLWIAYKSILGDNFEGIVKCNGDNKLEININNLKIFFQRIITIVTPHWIKNFKLTELKKDVYSNYLEGIVWCLDSYANGRCLKFDYMYHHSESPHPLGVLYYLELINSEIPYPIVNLSHIPEKMYAILVLPKKAINLIDSKYHKIIDDELNFLFEEETCKECINFHDEVSELHKNIKLHENMDCDTTKMRKNISKISKQLGKHKKNHKSLTINDINFTLQCIKKI